MWRRVPRGPEAERWRPGWLWAAALVLVAASLAIRVAHRGPYVPGWDVLGAAQGAHLIATRTPGEILEFHREGRFHPTDVWNVRGVPVVLVPGFLATVWPWEYWNHVVTLLLFLAILALLGTALGATRADVPVLLLAWGASSTLLSQSVVGFAYITCFLPYALALFVVLRLVRRPLWTLIGAALAIELSWHGQELGRTVFVVFFASVLLIRGVPWTSRLLWLAAGAWQLRLTILHPHYNTGRWRLFVPSWSELAEMVPAFLRHAFVHPQIDAAPFLLLGLVCLLCVRRHRWLWRSLAVVHVGLVLVLASNSVEFVWPRRALMVLFLWLAGVVALHLESGQRTRRVLLACLVMANAWQMATLLRWRATPLPGADQEWGFSLPHVWSSVENMVPFLDVDWYLELRDRVDRGEKLLLLYNLSAYDENHTNPSGVLERLYLHLGHDRFVDSVFVFGSAPCRWVCLPIRPLDRLDAFLAGVTEPASFVGYEFVHEADGNDYRGEIARLRAGIARRFDIEEVGAWRSSPRGVARYVRFALLPRPAVRTSPSNSRRAPGR